MAPRWSSNGSSGSASLKYTYVAVIALVTLAAGAFGGYAVAQSSNQSEAVRVARTAIATSSVEGMATAEPNEAGAVKAATSLVVGIPLLANESDLVRQSKVRELISTKADPALANTFNFTLGSIRTALYGTNNVSTGGRVVVSPASYKSQVNEDGTVTVTIWYLMVFADPVQSAFRSAWFTSAVQLSQEDGWKVVSLAQTSGPTPEVLSAQETPDSLADAQPVLDNAFAYRYALAP